MTKSDLKEAFQLGSPVVSDGIQYKRVNALITRRIKNTAVLQAELLDANENSVTIAQADRIELAETEETSSSEPRKKAACQ